jgi:hypothetical protein
VSDEHRIAARRRSLSRHSHLNNLRPTTCIGLPPPRPLLEGETRPATSACDFGRDRAEGEGERDGGVKGRESSGKVKGRSVHTAPAGARRVQISPRVVDMPVPVKGKKA